MSDTPTHAEVLAAIDKARYSFPLPTRDRADHCDDLRAIAERHAPDIITTGGVFHEALCEYCSMMEPWPCPDVQQIIDRLTGWGVL